MWSQSRGSETVSGNMGMPRPETKRSGIFGKIPDLDRDRRVWSGPGQVPIGPGPNFPNTNHAREGIPLPVNDLHLDNLDDSDKETRVLTGNSQIFSTRWISRIIMASILHFKVHTTYCISVRYIIPLLYMQQWCLSFILSE